MTRRVNRKSKGNTLLLAIMVSMVLIITGVMVTTAVMNSSRLNINQRINNDLYYAAESGLDKGQVIIAKPHPTNPLLENDKVVAIMSEPTGAYVILDTINNFDTNVEEIIIEGKKITDTKIQLRSTAKKRGSSKTTVLTGEVNKGFGPEISSLYQYSLVGNELQLVMCGGATAIDFAVTKIGYKNNVNVELWDKGVTPAIKLSEPTIKKENITLNIPPMVLVGPAPLSPGPTGLPGDIVPEERSVSVDVGSGVKVNEALDLKTESQGVRKVSLTLDGSRTLKIYIINADKFYINNIVGEKHSLLEESIIICKGEVIVSENKNEIVDYRIKPSGLRDDFSESMFKYYKATIIANKLSIYGTNFHCTYPLVMKDDAGAFITHGILQSDTEVNRLNNILETEMPGWTLAGGGAGGSSTGGWGSVRNIQ